MNAFDPNPNLTWLFVFAHPDDEISICAWIRRLTQAGAEVHLAWTHSNGTREAEGRAVALLLGVPERNLHFLNGTDGQMAEEMPMLLPKLERVIAQARPHRVVCPAYEQGHIDHDATNLLVHTAYGGPIFEVPLYHTYLTRFQRLNRFADPRGQQLLQLEPDEQRLKTTIARQYPSQNIWSILLWYEMWHKARLRPMRLTRTERMRLKTWDNYLRPNLPEPLARKVRRTATFKRWRGCVRTFREHLDKREHPERQLAAV